VVIQELGCKLVSDTISYFTVPQRIINYYSYVINLPLAILGRLTSSLQEKNKWDTNKRKKVVLFILTQLETRYKFIETFKKY
jgi:hypothetical protein